MDKKKNTTLIVILVAAAMIIVAAGIIGLNIFVNQQKGNKKADNTVTHTAIEADENKSENKLENTSDDGKADGAIADFVQAGSLKLGNYVGIEVDVEPTEDDIVEAMKENIEKNLKKMTKDHKGKIQEEDYVCVTYKGSIDGQEYEDFSEKNVVLRVGDYELDEDIEESLIGKQPGDKVSVSVTYDDFYGESESETVDYKITIKGKFDDYYADKFSEGKYPTVKQYIDYMTETVRAKNKTPEIAGQIAWDSVTEDSEVLKYPEGLVEEETVITKKQYENFAEFMGVSYEELLEQSGMDEDGLEEVAKETVKERLVVKTIMAKENLVLDDASYEKYLREAMEEDAELTLEELEQKYKEEYGDHPKDDMMLCLVQEFVGGKAKTE